MLHMAFFSALLFLSSGYAIWRGGAPERIVGWAMILAYVATLFSHSAFAGRFTHVEIGVLIVDTALFVVLMIVVLRADRGWPFLVAGLHIATLGAHAVRLLKPEIIQVTYAVMLSMWSYPMVIALAVGTHRHQQRLRAFGYDLDWSLPLPAKGEPDAG